MAKKNDELLYNSLQDLQEAIDSIEQTLFAMALNAKRSKENSESLKNNYDHAFAGFCGTLNLQELFERVHQISSDKGEKFKALYNLNIKINEICSTARILLSKVKETHKQTFEMLSNVNLSSEKKFVLFTEQLNALQLLMREFSEMEENYTDHMENIMSITIEVDNAFKLLMKFNKGLLLQNGVVLSDDDEFLYCLLLRKPLTVLDKQGEEVAVGIIDDWSKHSVNIGTVVYLQDSHSFRL